MPFSHEARFNSSFKLKFFWLNENWGKNLTGFSVVLSHDLSRGVTAWDHLSAQLKAAILAIVNAVIKEEGR